MKWDCGPDWYERWKAKAPERQRRAREAAKWQPWFAWFPVRVDKRDCRWLETIERRYNSDVYPDLPLFWSRQYRGRP